MPDSGHDRRVLTYLVGILVVIGSVWTLRELSIVAVPLALALFVAILVEPLKRHVERHLPRPLGFLGIAAALSTAGLVLAVMAGAVWWAISAALGKIPQYAREIDSAWESIQAAAQSLGIRLETSRFGGEGTLSSLVMGVLQTALSSMFTALTGLLLVLFLTALMLSEWPIWQDKVHRLDQRHGTEAHIAMLEIEWRIRRYLLVRTVLGAITATLIWSWLMITGTDFPYLFALLAFVLNYVPTLGSIIAGIPPIVLAVLQHGLGYGLVVASGLLAIEQIIGNYIDPRVQGHTVRLSSLVVLLSVVFWAWVWGPLGALLAVPMTVAVVVACAGTPATRPIALLLSKKVGDAASARDEGKQAESAGQPGGHRGHAGTES